MVNVCSIFKLLEWVPTRFGSFAPTVAVCIGTDDRILEDLGNDHMTFMRSLIQNYANPNQ